jgi:hypothetical protein
MSNSSVTLQERCRGTTPGFRRILGHMVSRRFTRPGYYLARSSPGFRLATAYNLDSQSCMPSSGLGQGFRSTSKIPSGQGGDSSYRQPMSRLPQPHIYGPKGAEGILEAHNRPIPVKPVLTGSSFQNGNHRSMAAAILPGDWAVSLDLWDVYLHVPVHPDYQHYLRFYFEGRVYQLCLSDWPLLR